MTVVKEHRARRNATRRRRRSHDDVGLGALLDSNLFTGLTVVGVSAATPPGTDREMAVALGFGMLIVLLPAARPCKYVEQKD